MPAVLPHEVLALIIQQLSLSSQNKYETFPHHDNTAGLAGCCLASKELLALARPALYRHLHLCIFDAEEFPWKSTSDFYGLEQTFDRNPHLALFVRSISFETRIASLAASLELHLPSFRRILDKCRNVEALFAHNLSVLGPVAEVIASARLHLRTLSLNGHSLGGSMAFVATVELLLQQNNLEDLSIDFGEDLSDVYTWRGERPTFRLRRLSCQSSHCLSELSVESLESLEDLNLYFTTPIPDLGTFKNLQRVSLVSFPKSLCLALKPLEGVRLQSIRLSTPTPPEEKSLVDVLSLVPPSTVELDFTGLRATTLDVFAGFMATRKLRTAGLDKVVFGIRREGLGDVEVADSGRERERVEVRLREIGGENWDWDVSEPKWHRYEPAFVVTGERVGTKARSDGKGGKVPELK
ncbi:hypothetical protein T439DRAFT_380709 [Meredithblackwellia eburnea MCA 4105]